MQARVWGVVAAARETAESPDSLGTNGRGRGHLPQLSGAATILCELQDYVRYYAAI